MDTRALPALALALVALLAAAPALAAAAGAGLSIVSVDSYNVTFTSKIVEKSVTIPANGSVSINITKPAGFWSNHTAYMIVAVSNVTSNIQLAAYAGNQQVASATVVPLSTAYTQTLPATVDKITLSSSAVANATIKVYLVSDEVEFTLTLSKNSVSVSKGGNAEIEFTIRQTAGGPVYVWPTVQADQPLVASVYYYDVNNVKVPWTSQTAPRTTGSGWMRGGVISIEWPDITPPQPGPQPPTVPPPELPPPQLPGPQPVPQPGPIPGPILASSNNVAYVRVYFWADVEGANPEGAQLVAMVELSGTLDDDTANLSTGTSIDAKMLGLGIIAMLLLFMLFGKGGRRGLAGANPIVLLALLAALAIGLGLIDVHPSVDARMLGIGVIALLLFLMLAKPQAVRKAARRLGL